MLEYKIRGASAPERSAGARGSENAAKRSSSAAGLKFRLLICIMYLWESLPKSGGAPGKINV